MDSLRAVAQYFWGASKTESPTPTAKAVSHQAAVISSGDKLAEEADAVHSVAGKMAAPDAAQCRKSISGSRAAIGTTVHVDGKALAKSHTAHSDGPIQLTKEEQKLAKRQEALYQVIVANLSHDPDFDHEAVRHTIDVGLRELHEAASKGREQGITMKLGDLHIISYFNKEGKLKHIPWPGLENITPENIIGEGGRSIVFQVGQKDNPKALKGVHDAEETEPIYQIRETLANLHSSHEDGKVPGLEPAPKIVRVLTGEIDPKTGEPEFFAGALTRRFTGDASHLGPHPDTGSLPKKVFMAQRFGEVFHAVAFMHSQGLAHRDIKPENILTDSKGFYLSDFGDVTPPEQWTEDDYAFSTAPFTTLQDMEALSSAFEAGDLDRAQDIREKMDVLAMGASMYRVLTGHNLFEQVYPIDPSTDRMDTQHVVKGAKQSIVQIGKQYGKEFQTLIARTLHPDLDQRPTAAECEAVLKGMLLKMS